MAQQPDDDNQNKADKNVGILEKTSDRRHEWMKSWFDNCNTDMNNKYLSKDETMEVIKSFGFDNHQAQLLSIFDENKDGNVTLDEFVNCLEYVLQLKEEQIEWVSHVFAIYDFDNDGKIGKSEWDNALLNREKTKQELDHAWQSALKSDANNDGKLTFADFLRWTDEIEASIVAETKAKNKEKDKEKENDNNNNLERERSN